MNGVPGVMQGYRGEQDLPLVTAALLEGGFAEAEVRGILGDNIRRVLKDYTESGSVSSLLPLWGFVDEYTFLTKTGAIGVLYRLEGADAWSSILSRPPVQSVPQVF